MDVRGARDFAFGVTRRKPVPGMAGAPPPQFCSLGEGLDCAPRTRCANADKLPALQKNASPRSRSQ